MVEQTGQNDDQTESARAATRTGKSATAFRTISEVANELDVAQHVLRFWESKFPQVRPLKRGGGRRYYRPEDVDLLRQIRGLLYDEGYTIKGAQKLLRSQRRRPEGEVDETVETKVSSGNGTASAKPAGVASAGASGLDQDMLRRLRALRRDLNDARQSLRKLGI